MALTKQAKSLSFLRWLLLLPLPVLWCVLHQTGGLKFLESKTVDWRFQYRGEIPSPIKVLYVDIDSLSLDEIGGMPWTRHYFASVCSALVNEAKVKAIGIDLVFSEAGMSQSSDQDRHRVDNREFGRFLHKQPPVVLAASYVGWQYKDINRKKTLERHLPVLSTDSRTVDQMEPPELPAFDITEKNSKQKRVYNPPYIGLIDTVDQGTRWIPAWAPSNIKRSFYHMSVELARLYWGLPNGSLSVEGDQLVFKKPDGSIQAKVPLRDRQLVEINWFTRWYSPHSAHAEFSDVYNYSKDLVSQDPAAQKAAKEYFAQDDFKDAVVLIGPVDKLLQDVAPTSLDDDPVPKVSVHGNMLKTIVSGLFLTRLSPKWDYAIIIALTLIVTTLSLAGGARALFAKIMAVLALAVYTALTFRVFEQTHLVLPFTAPLGAALTTSFAGLIWQVIDEQKAKGRIKGMFGAYVSPQLVERMVESGEDPKLGGHEDEITAYFSDIQSFSSFSEKLPPAQLVELMNEYLTACTDIVQAQGGTLDKYIGDAVVAMFGAPIPLPDHAFRACVATQLVHQKLAELRAKWKSEGDKWPEIVWKMQSRIGLNSGLATIGNMGSRTRFNYTMMGDNVNLAARMESGSKAWGAYTMVAEPTKTKCIAYNAERVVFRALGRIQVMGRSQAVPIHEIVGLKETVGSDALECIHIFERALAKYYERDWNGALELFRQAVPLEINQPGKTPGVKTNPSLVYINITENYKVQPPAENWDGVYVMTEK